MSLIDCAACGRQISSEAISCPQCGHPNRPSTRTPAGYKLEWQQFFSAADAAEADINRAFIADPILGEWLNLTAPDGTSLFAMIEPGGLYSLQHHDARTKERICA